jgi:glucose-6-phosphate 1-dehydrogenase
MTETYTAVRLSIDDEAWKDVPIFIRTGKALAQKVTEVTIVFSNPCNPSRNNLLTIRIQPNEGIVIDLRIKKPGFYMAYEDVQLDFCYTGTAIADHPEAYERVLVDGMRGDRTLFASDAEVLSCWKITEPILEAWKNPDFPLHFYDKGSWGPQAADQLVEKSGIPWLTDEHPVCTPPRIVHHD